ncbi:MAG: 3D-(3,5/4)-trihydroxycyclohexane-1,2-dione acylhydrolase (decyclizing), partial [Nonomuraea sp.]|nr:3D-(3,5/4)-trihydroxycyclohexane-1,2-dione acylhydrolase (decyclizing) [Nonomuraea sp.]
MRLTTSQALVRFLAAQWSERDGVEQRLIAGVLGIFGHGNVAGVGQALAEQGAGTRDPLPYYLARNEQAMVHTAVGYARTRSRLSTFACTTSIGPGATNLATGAALATVNRLPVLLLPGDIFATRAPGTVLQELEDPRSYDVSVNDSLRPLSRFFDRINRPEQLPSALLAAMRVLTDPAETGAVTLALPQDVQAEAYDWPEELFARRVWHVPRPVPEPAALARAKELLRASRRPLVVAGGGVKYSEAWEELLRFAENHGVPVGETQAGKGALPYDHPCAVGAIGHTGTDAANTLAREADLVIGVGTRYTDFTTASRTLFGQARFLNVNVTALDAAKNSGLTLVADAREALRALGGTDWRADPAWTHRAAALAASWQSEIGHTYAGAEFTQP